MIIEKITHKCTKCGSTNIRRNGLSPAGKQKFHCKACNTYSTLEPDNGYSDEFKETVLKAYDERSSMRGIGRTFGISRPTLVRWIQKKASSLSTLAKTLLPARSDDILELDEVWSFIEKKACKSWTWIALNRRTRQVVGYAVGSRETVTCEQLFSSIPAEYKFLDTISDFWSPYPKVFDSNHKAVGKEDGGTAHIERWNNTLRQHVGRFIRKTLSFSKSEEMHKTVLKLFIHRYNLSIKHGRQF
jgi:insertion element IS1 protein InsB